MKTPHLAAAAAAALFTVAASHAAVVSETFGMSTTTTIPDGDLSGLVQSITPVTTISVLDNIVVTLNTSGGWNGDLYAYLWHNGEISILVNRIGRTTINDFGSATGGMDLTLSDTATTDIHSATGGSGSSLSGTFQPDGRNIHPLNALDTTPRSAGLGTFTGDPAGGEYRLFIADVSSGDTATLNSWSITLTGEAVPEPHSAILAALGALALLRRQR